MNRQQVLTYFAKEGLTYSGPDEMAFVFGDTTLLAKFGKLKVWYQHTIKNYDGPNTGTYIVLKEAYYKELYLDANGALQGWAEYVNQKRIA